MASNAKLKVPNCLFRLCILVKINQENKLTSILLMICG
jgi:hypothetical protein